MSSKSLHVDSAVIFYPRGGSAQVVKYLAENLKRRDWGTRIHAGSLGKFGANSNAESFYDGADLATFSYDEAQTAFLQGGDPLCSGLDKPFHPSYEDRGVCPDRRFSEVSPSSLSRLVGSWREHLAEHIHPKADVLHLHHLSHLQRAAHEAAPNTPRVTTLHGTELKLVDGMTKRLDLARRVHLNLEQLAQQSAVSGGPIEQSKAALLEDSFGLGAEDKKLLDVTDWRQWVHSEVWIDEMRYAWEKAGTLIVVSEHDRAEAQRLLSDRDPRRPIHVVPNGVDTTQFRPRELTRDERLGHLKKWLVDDPKGWSPGAEIGSISYSEGDLNRLLTPDGQLRPVLLWCGRFLDFKRVPTLLRAFAETLKYVEPSPVLLMWGGFPGEYEGRHPETIADDLGIRNHVFFVGWRGHQELPVGLACADLMVAPAVNEPFGMVYIEAMACGTPPIATNTGGPARIIEGNGLAATGWKVRPDDDIDLSRAIIAALSDVTERERRSRNAVKLAHNSFSWDKTVDLYQEIYTDESMSRGKG